MASIWSKGCHVYRHISTFISELGLISRRLFKDTYFEKFTAKSTNSRDFQLLILKSSLSIYLKVEDDYNLE